MALRPTMSARVEIKDGDKTYTVTAVNSVKAEAGTHQYEGTFNWVEVKDDDGNVTGYTCETADLKCAKCGDEQKGVKVNLTDATTAATCTEAGKITYTANAVAEDGETVLATETKELTTDKALGHDYKAVFTWAEDNKSATADLTCSRGDSELKAQEAKVEVKTSDATCTEGGKVTYTATVYAEDGTTVLATETKTVDSDALGHDYKAENVKWNDDHTEVTADLVCSRCNDTQKDQKGSISNVTEAATCTKAGKVTYTAKFILDDKVVATETAEKTLDALGHDYKAVFTWAEDYQSATADLTCSRGDSELKAQEAKVTVESKDATCTEGGTATYTATVYAEDGKTVLASDNKTTKVDALGHEYKAENVKWNDDHTEVTADLVCSRCNDTQKDQKGAITSVTEAATCTKTGKITYTAKFILDDKVVATETAEKTLDALGHDYKAVFTWAEDNKSATAEITCSRCNLKETKDAAITVESKDATCTEGGTATYTATVTIDGVTLTDSKTVQVEALGHKYGISEVKWSADNSTATATLVCNRCHDSKSQTVNSVREVVKEANCTEDGSIRYTAVFDVDGANVEYQKNVMVSALGHNYVDGVCTRCGKESEHLTVYAGDGLNYASVYDYNYYIKKYPDVVKKVGTDDAKVLAYFVEQGMAQHQQGSAQFDPVSYRLEYADLRKAYGNTWAGYYRHYVRWGEAAGLHGTGCTEMQNYVTELNGMDYASVYDYNYYIAKYPSVFNKYGYDDAAVLSYFVEKGMTYHQQASAEFDPVSYRFEYADLRKAYGDTWAGYYNHYVRWGKAAGLHGTGCTEMKDYVTVYGSMDYASVYDYNYYIAKYPEVLNKVGYDDQKVLNYFVEQGMAQHQQASAEFDPVSYRFEYADLRKAYGDTWAGYYNHYVRWGKAAGLHGTGCTEMKDYVTVYGSMDYASVYDYNYYIAKYPEVLNKVGYDDQKVLNYFVEQGMAQHQQASAEFDPVSYRFEYADLRKAYGDTWAGYYNHYVRWGKAAGLQGTGCTELSGYATVYAGNGLDYAAVYDYNYYIAKYPEVLNKVGYDDQKVLNYFVEQGMAQHQQASAEFDPVYYRNSNPSLQNAYGDTWAGYYNHYVRWGKAAGLQGAEQQ